MDKLVPYPDKLDFFQKIQLYLFDDPKDIPYYHKLLPTEIVIKERYKNVFTWWLDKPMVSEKKVIDYMVKELGISKSQAYRDMPNIKLLLGNVRNAAKEWQRFKVISIIDRATELAEEKKSAKDLINAAAVLGKYTQLDKEETLKIPWDEVIPQPFEITGDVTVLNIEPITNLKEVQRKLREKYGGGAVIDDVEEAEEVTNE